MNDRQRHELDPEAADPLIQKLEDDAESDDESDDQYDATDEMGKQSFPTSDPPSTWAGGGR